MKTYMALMMAFFLTGCLTDQHDFYSLLVISNTNTVASPAGLVSTANGVDEDGMHPPALQIQPYPVVRVKDRNMYVLNTLGPERITRYRCFPNGTFGLTDSLVLPPGSGPKDMILPGSDLGFCSLSNAGKIIAFSASSMRVTATIDLSPFAIGDASPDPTQMAYDNGKLYVVCVQVYAGKTVPSPAQLLIIDLVNGNKITSITDDRAGYLGTATTPSSLFLTETGDLYFYCASSWGSARPALCGFLRVKAGQAAFDQSYFFNPSLHSIAGVEGSHIDYLQHPVGYTARGILYSTGNIPALAGNPQNYTTDRSYGSFSIDLVNQTIEKIGFPYSNGYASNVFIFKGTVYFGLSTKLYTGVFSILRSKESQYGPEMSIINGQPWYIAALD